MNRTKLMLLMAAGLLCLGTLAACGEKDGDADRESAKDSETAKAPAQTEAVTAPPRHDYLEAEVLPDVTIEKKDYTDLKLTIPSNLKIEAGDVQEYIQKTICFEKREAVNGTTQVQDKALSLGDDAYIYYKGFKDGKEFEGGSNWDDKTPYTLPLGSGTFIPGFEESLVGVIPNETSKDKPFELKITFPEDYNSEELAGKEVVFQVVVAYAVQYQIPEYNWEFVEKVLKYELKETFYASDRARLDEFEEYVYDTLIAQNEPYVENAKIDALWQHLTDVAACKNLPASEVEFYYSNYVAQMESDYQSYISYAGEEAKKQYPNVDAFAIVYMGLDKGADWKAELHKQAEKLVKKDMIGHAIGELEGIESVTDEEYKAQVKYWVDSYYGYMTEAEIIKSMGETFLRESAYAEKIQNWLLERVTFTYDDGTSLGGDKADAETGTDAETGSETGEGTAADTTAETVADTTADTVA